MGWRQVATRHALRDVSRVRAPRRQFPRRAARPIPYDWGARSNFRLGIGARKLAAGSVHLATDSDTYSTVLLSPRHESTI